MKKIVLLPLSLIFLASCSLPWAKDIDMNATPSVTPTQTGMDVSSTSSGQKNMMVTLNYTLHEDSPTGKIVDTSLESVAKEAGLYQSGNTYKPFEFVLGTNQVVPGFEAGVATMKKGEKKMIVVAPKDGYGELVKTEVDPRNSLAPTFTTTVDKNMLEDTISQTVSRAMLGEQGKTLTVGQTLTGGEDMTAKVIKIEGDNITLSIDNKQNPFYGKKVAV